MRPSPGFISLSRTPGAHAKARLSVSGFDEALAVTLEYLRLALAGDGPRDVGSHDLGFAVREHASLGQRLAERKRNTDDVADGIDVLEARLERLAVDSDPTALADESGVMHDAGCTVRRHVGEKIELHLRVTVEGDATCRPVNLGDPMLGVVANALVFDPSRERL